MIVDSSAFIALVENEKAHVEPLVAALTSGPTTAMAAPTAAETLIVLTARHGPSGPRLFDRLRTELEMAIVPFVADHVVLAQQAYARFGKGRHPAALNFGDCMTYAAARHSGEPLVAVGDDFPATDLRFDGGVVGYWPSDE